MIGLGRNSWTKAHAAALRVLLGLAVAAAGVEQLALLGSGLRTGLAVAQLACGLLLVAGRADQAAALVAAGLCLGLDSAGTFGAQAGLVGGVLLLVRHAAYPLPPGAAAIGWRLPPHVLVLTRAVLTGVLVAKAATGAWWPHTADGIGSLLLLLAAAEPAWIPALRADGIERVFFDGGCGLCHRSVLLLLQEDREEGLRFAPLGGETFRRLFPAERAAALPDSLVVVRGDGAALVRSAALVHLGHRLGGGWRIGALVLGAVPRRLADWTYDRIATVRGRWFAAPQSACPMTPPDLRWRFEG